MTPIHRAARPVLLVLLASAFGPGCVAVHSWERETLGHPCMALGGELGDGFRAHYLPIREGAIGGEGGIGGGCGCN